MIRILLSLVMQSQKQKEKRLQTIVVVLSISSFVMFLIVMTLSWYILDFSSSQNETQAQLYTDFESLKDKLVLDQQSVATNQEEGIIDTLFQGEIDYNNLTTEQVVAMVSKHMLLANGDITVATVTNIIGMQEDFPILFQYTKNGDKLLFYPLGIIIYDPVLDKVVDVLRRFPGGILIPENPDQDL